MNILCIGYYDKFSRFFLEIKKELKKEDYNLNFFICSLYISGFLYGLLRGQKGNLLSFQVWLSVLFRRKKYEKQLQLNPTHYKNLELLPIIRYQLDTVKKANKKNLLLQAVAYIDYLEKKMEQLSPAYLLLIGDSRMAIDIAKQLATSRGIKIFYIEQAPYQSTFFDSNGVNANASLKDFSFENCEDINETDISEIKKYLTKPKRKKYNRSFVYRGIDYLVEAILNKTTLYPPDLKIDAPVFGKRKKTEKTTFNFSSKNNFLLICQVPFDVNMTHHSPCYKNHFDILRDVFTNLPKDSQLIVREHPIYKGKYGNDFYNFIEEHQLFVANHLNLNELLLDVDVVVVNNSTVGLEAIAQQKSVVLLGNAYYHHPELCLKLLNKYNLKVLLKEALLFKPKLKNVICFLNYFFKDYLINGFITDKDLIASRAIAEKIKLHYNNQIR